MKLKNRPRRMRASNFTRLLMRESQLSANDLILPLFVIEGKNQKQSISSMHDVFRLSQDLILKKIEAAANLGINAVVLFPVIENNLKTNSADEAFNDDGLIQRTIKKVKKEFPEMGIITDIALDPYTLHGQDGLVDKNGYVINDATVDVLSKQALSHAKAGADIVAPSDMMDGRVGEIRNMLENEIQTNTKILSYTAKYASSFYGPFREAVDSKNNLGNFGKESYQMDPHNTNEALKEAELDINEGADILMIKPAGLYLDIIHRIKNKFMKPTFAYQVSGEYAMLKAASLNGWLDERAVVLESLVSIKRAGSDAILTYFALEAAQWLRDDK
jgi:porphobilinogen synthase